MRATVPPGSRTRTTSHGRHGFHSSDPRTTRVGILFEPRSTRATRVGFSSSRGQHGQHRLGFSSSRGQHGQHGLGFSSSRGRHGQHGLDSHRAADNTGSTVQILVEARTLLSLQPQYLGCQKIRVRAVDRLPMKTRGHVGAVGTAVCAVSRGGGRGLGIHALGQRRCASAFYDAGFVMRSSKRIASPLHREVPVVAGLAGPARRDIPQRQPDASLPSRRLESGRGLDDSAHTRVHALERIGDVDHATDRGREGEERDDLQPSRRRDATTVGERSPPGCARPGRGPLRRPRCSRPCRSGGARPRGAGDRAHWRGRGCGESDGRCTSAASSA